MLFLMPSFYYMCFSNIILHENINEYASSHQVKQWRKIYAYSFNNIYLIIASQITKVYNLECFVCMVEVVIINFH